MQSFKFLRYALIGFEISPFSGQNRVILGGRGGPRIFFLLESSYFCYLGAHAKFQIHTICPYWGLATAGTRKQQQENNNNKKRKNIKNSGLRRFRRNRLHSAARTNLVTWGHMAAFIHIFCLFTLHKKNNSK